MAPTTTQRIARGLAVALGTLLALCVLLEVGLRLIGDRTHAFDDSVNRLHRRWVALLDAGIYEEVEHPVRRYAMRPGAQVDIDGWTFRVNAHRARGEEFPIEKPSGEKRILALGDSFCFGLWCDEDETLVGHLARMANEQLAAAGETEVRWRAVNLGVPGYHSGQQLAAFEEDGLRLDPDVVLLYFNTNDIVTEGFFLDEELAVLRTDEMPLPTGLRRALWNSHLYGWIVRKTVQHWSSRTKPHLDPSVPWAHTNPRNQRTASESLAAIAGHCRDRNIPLFMVHQPLMTWSADVWRADWDILPLVDWAEDLRAELRIPGVNLLGWMRGRADGVDPGPTAPDAPRDFLLEPFFADEEVQRWVAAERSGQPLTDARMPDEPDFHLTGEGYGSAARVVYAAMQAEGFLP